MAGSGGNVELRMELTTAYLLIEVTDTRTERMPQLPGDLSRPDPGARGRGCSWWTRSPPAGASPSGRPALAHNGVGRTSPADH
ncbi:hypothetical protein [Streptomyces harbinensis]